MKKFLWVILILVLVGIIYALTLWFKPHRDIEGEDARYSLSATELSTSYSGDESASNELYLDQVVAVKGRVAEVADDHITLEAGVYCSGDFSGTDVKEGDRVTVKGRVVSYDSLFEEVRIDNAIVEND